MIDAVDEAVEGLSASGRRDDEILEQAVRAAIRRVIRNETGKRPATDVHVVRVTPALIDRAEK